MPVQVGRNSDNPCISVITGNGDVVIAYCISPHGHFISRAISSGRADVTVRACPIDRVGRCDILGTSFTAGTFSGAGGHLPPVFIVEGQPYGAIAAVIDIQAFAPGFTPYSQINFCFCTYGYIQPCGYLCTVVRLFSIIIIVRSDFGGNSCFRIDISAQDNEIQANRDFDSNRRVCFCRCGKASLLEAFYKAESVVFRVLHTSLKIPRIGSCDLSVQSQFNGDGDFPHACHTHGAKGDRG